MDFTYELITVVHYQAGLRCRLTQHYLPEFNMGHYCFTITNADGHLLRAFSTAGGAPEGKAKVAWCQEVLADSLRFNKKDWIERGWMS